MTPRTAIALGLASLTLATSAQVVQKGNKYAFSYALKKGLVMTYELTTAASAPGSSKNAKPMTFRVPIKLEVLSIKGEDATVKLTVKDPMSGQTNDRVVQMNRHGVTSKGLSGEGFAVINLPPKPVAVGEKWSSNTPVSVAGMGSMKTTNVTTFKGFSTVSGKKVAVFAVNSSVTGTASMTTTGTLNILMSDGWMLGGAMDTDATVAMGSSAGSKPMKIKSKATIKRL